MKKTLLFIVSFLILFFSTYFLSSNIVFASEDTKIEIDTIVATSNLDTPTYGDAYNNIFNFEFTEGEQAHIEGVMCYWEKYENEEWVRYNGSFFREGTYRFIAQIRIDGSAGLTHKFADDFTVNIDNVDWELLTFANYGTYSYGYIQSNEFTVEKIALPLNFVDSYRFDITTVIRGTPISEFSIASAAYGGTESYVFSKTSGPTWALVSEDGTISGNPNNIGSNDELVVRVTDSNSDYREISLWVADTTMDPEDREDVSVISGYSNIDFEAIVDNSLVFSPTNFEFMEGEEARVAYSMNNWYKYDGEEWLRYDDNYFTEGRYYFSTQIRIDGTYGVTHKFGGDLKITIDGEEWTYDQYYVFNTYSYVFVISPEFEVVDVPREFTFSFDANGGTGEMAEVNVMEGDEYTLPECTFTAPEYQEFDCWEYNWSDKNPGDVITVCDDAIITAKWKDIPPTVISEIEINIEYEYIIDSLNNVDLSKATLSPEGYIITDYAWFDITEESWCGKNEKFIVGHSYQIGLNLNTTKAYVFDLASNISAKINNFDAIVNGNVDKTKLMVALVLEEPISYSVSFDAKEGSGAMETLISGKEFEIPESTFTAPENMVFDSWYIEGLGEKQVGDIIELSEDIVLEAKWLHVCSLEPVSKIDPICATKSNGKQAYYQCSSCDKKYEDEAGTLLISNFEEWGIIQYQHNFTGDKVIIDNDNHAYKCVNPNCLEIGNLEKHSFGDYQHDDDKHWKECECGQIAEQANHSGGTATCDLKPNCEVCNTPYKEALGHTKATEWSKDENNHWYECTACDTQEFEKAIHKDENNDCLCDTCAYVMHVHTYDKYSTDSTKHWKECSDQNCPCKEASIIESENHLGGNATCTALAVCEKCSLAYGSLKEHNYNSEWIYDEVNHWKECSCKEIVNKDVHIDNDEDNYCDVCQYLMYIPKKMSGGAIAAIVISSTLVLGSGGFSLYWFVIKKKNFSELKELIKKTVNKFKKNPK